MLLLLLLCCDAASLRACPIFSRQPLKSSSINSLPPFWRLKNLTHEFGDGNLTSIWLSSEQQQKEEEAIVALTNLNNNYSENFFPNFDNNNGNNNNTNNGTIHHDHTTSSGAPRNSSRYSIEILHSLREEAVPHISSLFFKNGIEYNHSKDDIIKYQQQSNNFTNDGINSVMSDTEPLAV